MKSACLQSGSRECLHIWIPGMEYLVAKVTHWLQYAASDIMQFAQKVAADALLPAVRKEASGILGGFALSDNRNIRRCIARNVAPLLQNNSSREDGLSLLVLCKYDLGRYGTDILWMLWLAFRIKRRAPLIPALSYNWRWSLSIHLLLAKHTHTYGSSSTAFCVARPDFGKKTCDTLGSFHLVEESKCWG